MTLVSLHPSTADPALLESQTVANDDVIDAIAGQIVKHGRGRSPGRGCVVIGGFGSGKTHCLAVALHRARSELRGRTLSVAWISLGGASIVTYPDLLVEVVRATASRPHSFVEKAQRLRRDPAIDDAARIAELERIALDEAADGNPLVIVLEGLGDVLLQLSAGDRARLVEVLNKRDGDARVPILIGSSARPIETIDGEAFRQYELAPLTIKQAFELLARAIRVDPTITPSSSNALEALWRTSTTIDPVLASNPRFWSLVVALLRDGASDALSSAFEAFLSMLDMYFQQKLQRLPPSERRVILELGRAARPLTVGEIAELVGTSNQSAATAIGRLTEDGWVLRIQPAEGADGRLRWYELTEPLLRHHLRWHGGSSPNDFVLELANAWKQQQAVRSDIDDGLQSLPSPDELERTGDLAGESGNAIAARDHFRASLGRRIEVEGLLSARTLHTFARYGAWIGDAGDANRARSVLSAALASVDAFQGPTSGEALQIMLGLAWSHASLGDFQDAKTVLDRAIERATSVSTEHEAGSNLIEWLLQARQDRARVLGELGDPQAAVEEFRHVLADRQEKLPRNRTAMRTNRHGLAWWTGAAGDPAAAVALFASLEADPEASDYERLHYQSAAANWAGYAEGPPQAVKRYLDLADSIAVSRLGKAHGLAVTARCEALKWSLRIGRPSSVALPTVGVPPKDFAEIIGGEVLAGRLSLDEVQDLIEHATSEQIDALVIGCISVRTPMPIGWRIAITELWGARMTGISATLVTDFGRALEGDPRAESGMPTQWKPMLHALRALDQLASDRISPFTAARS
jgi:tetratricopeptide (TPR) repeat protein